MIINPEALIELADSSRDGEISFDEFFEVIFEIPWFIKAIYRNLLFQVQNTLKYGVVISIFAI